MMVSLLSYLQAHAKVLKWVFFAYLLGTLFFDFLIDRHHPHFWGDSVIGFWALFSIFGCLGMIVFCKGLSHVWLSQREDFYDSEDSDNDE
ncbi:MAG: hypothetical protein J7L25_13155 [Deltaproteobacteria bacterium]|nr:hypothetical protein [Candidatus Tharpella aukensis]